MWIKSPYDKEKQYINLKNVLSMCLVGSCIVFTFTNSSTQNFIFKDNAQAERALEIIKTHIKKDEEIIAFNF